MRAHVVPTSMVVHDKSVVAVGVYGNVSSTPIYPTVTPLYLLK